MEQVKQKSKDQAVPTRRERALATRLAIIHAASAEFEANGYYATTMTAIAARAGVAVQTVHFVFHTKGELLGAVVDNAVLGDENPTPPERTDWYRAALAEPDARVALHSFVLASGAIFARASAMNEVARSAATTDPDARATFERIERLRAESYLDVVERMAAKGPLRAGLDLSSATDVLLTLVSPRTYLSLTRDRNWTPAQATAWIADAAVALVLG